MTGSMPDNILSQNEQHKMHNFIESKSETIKTLEEKNHEFGSLCLQVL